MEFPNLMSYIIHNKHVPHGAYNVQFSVLDSQQSLFKLKKKEYGIDHNTEKYVKCKGIRPLPIKCL